ncbi:hypothetical protein QL285_039115 [Trifolium repens]|nr:hypothetical protein QL285_039115 [Trifolium repens]
MEKQWSDLTPYEVERQRTIEANNKKLEALNIPRLSQSIQKSSSTKKDRMRYVRPGDLQVAANSKRLRSNDIPKPSPRVITPPSSASQDAPPSSPTYDATSHTLTKKGRPKDDDGNVRQKSVEVKDLIPNKVGFKVQTIWNDDHQPVGEAAGLLSGYIGFLASSDELLPIMYPKWPKVSSAKKDLIYDNNIKAKFVVSDTNKFHKKWICTSLGKRWRERRCFLFNKYYDWALIVEQNIEQFPPEVTKDHWAMYLNYRLSPDTMAKADKNALNRQKQRISHTLGTRSLARTKDIMEQRDGRSYTRGDMYEISHTKRNGSYVNDEARQKNEELQKERQTSSDNVAFVTVFGKEHHGYVRGMGLGPTPSQINGSSCRPSGSTFSSTADAKIAKMQSEIDVLTKEVAEVNELKAKVAEFDAMKEQFALIMANMQNHGLT